MKKLHDNNISQVEYVSLTEAAAISGIPAGTLRQRCKRGTLPFKRAEGGKTSEYLIRPCDIDRQKAGRAAASPVEESNIASQTDQTCTNQVDVGEPVGTVPSGTNPSSNVSTKKRPVDHAKKSMRKLSVHDLLKLSNYIIGRISQKLDTKPTLSSGD